MAVFDLKEQKIYARVVYDGAANAGKTTNVLALSELFTSQRRSEVYTPEQLAGRTLFFDWIEIGAGLTHGIPLICQVVTVPGQAALATRRRRILSTADAVVFVTGSDPVGLEHGRRAAALLHDEIRRRDAPLRVVVQANKQDLPGALSAEAVREQLGLGEDAPATTARAADATGVLETFVLAVRQVSSALSTRASTQKGFRLAVHPAETPEEVYEILSREPLPHGWAEELLSEAAPDVALRGSLPPDSGWELEGEAGGPPAGASEGQGAEAAEPAEREPAADAAHAEPPASLQPEPPRDEAEPLTARPQAPPARSLTSRPPLAHDLPEGFAAPLPRGDVLSGFIWPAATGREILRALEGASVTLRSDLAGQRGLADGSGRPDALVCQSGRWCLKTSPRRRFQEAESGRHALIRAARQKTSLGDLLLPDTVLVLQPADDGGHWLWTVSPWVETLRGAMSAASHCGDEAALADALGLYAVAAVDALLLAARQGVALDAHPANFGVNAGRVFYIDDDVHAASALPMLGHALLARVDEYAEFARATHRYVEALAAQLEDRLLPSDVTRAELWQAVSDVQPRTSLGQQAKSRVLSALPVRSSATG